MSRFAGNRLRSNPAEVMPSDEVQDGLAYFVGHPLELGGDPVLEPGQVRVAMRQVSVVLEQRT